MKIISIHILKYDPKDSFLLASAYELSFISWYKRSFFQSGLNAGVKITCSRVALNENLAITLNDYNAVCYIKVFPNNIAVAVVTDDQYPQRVAINLIDKLYKENDIKVNLNQVSSDQYNESKLLNQIILDYQNADKMHQLQQNLDDIQGICKQTIDDIMRRGEKLDNLLEQTGQINKMSMEFYKNAKKTNQGCCL